MAAKKAKKTKKSKTAKKAVKKAARKAPAKKKTARKTKAKAAAKKKAPARKAATPKKAVAAKKKAPVRKKKQTVGEGDYEATRAFDRDQAAFVKQNKAKIPAMGRQAKAALDGAEGASLRQAEAEARRHAAPDSEAEPALGAWVIPPG
jgi:hypothetical protein